MANANDHDSVGSQVVQQVAESPPDREPVPVAPEHVESAASVAHRPGEPFFRVQRRKRLVLAVAGLVAIAAAGYFVVPKVRTALTTVSTDDAYVNGHFTFVAPRVAGQVVRVLVDDNNRVHKGDLLVQLDKEPFQIQVDQKQASLELAKANLVAAEDNARALLAQARSNRFKLELAIEQVNNQIALLRAKVAALDTSRARAVRAKADYGRAIGLQLTPGAISQQDVDQRLEAYKVAQAQVTQSLEEVHQVRVNLGLPAEPPQGHDLTEVPADLDQTYSAVRQSLADLLESAAPLGIVPKSYVSTPKELIAEFYQRDPEGNLDRIFAKLIPQIPAILQAKAQLKEAESALARAELDLKWCDVWAEIDGQVTRRNVNPGNNVQAGQSMMVVRSLTEVWIDANFKETQLAQLRIGQRVDMKVDMYGRSMMFPGRITGFTMGTGSTLALLPAENATGNFIKVVQRLPVRIEPIDYDPEKKPLFIGLSVVPYVQIHEPATGPHAGEFLQVRTGTPTGQVAPEKPQADKP